MLWKHQGCCSYLSDFREVKLKERGRLMTINSVCIKSVESQKSFKIFNNHITLCGMGCPSLCWEEQLQMMADCKTLTHPPVQPTHSPMHWPTRLSRHSFIRCQMELEPPWNCRLNSNPHFPTNFPPDNIAKVVTVQNCESVFFVAKVKWKCQIPDQTVTFCSSNPAKENLIKVPK